MRCRATSACSETSTLQPLLLKKSLQKDYRCHPSFTGKSTPLPANARVLERPEGAQLLLVVGWYWTVGRLMTTLDIEPDPALATQDLEMIRRSRETQQDEV